MTAPVLRRRSQAFTLVEIVVVLLIVGVLVAIAAAALYSHVTKSRDTAATATATQVRKAVVNASARADQQPTAWAAANVSNIAGAAGVTLPSGATLVPDSPVFPSGLQITVGSQVRCVSLTGSQAISQGGCSSTNAVYNPSAQVDLSNVRAAPVSDATNVSLTQVAAADAPTGTGTAFQYQLLRSQAAGFGYYLGFRTQSQPAASTGTIEFYARGTAGSFGPLQPMICNDAATSCPWSGGSFPLTTSWTKFTTSYTLSGALTDSTHYLRFAIGNNTAAQTIQVTGVRLTPTNP